ncbi:Orotidine 5'-phosphate decarboxylase [Escovopsis weberi]|uniref:Orotidine 5'-phosphate decarboxylase n=1 Tax=Escovopsis weberi TaxID=150374 RepID=A0A0N0RTR2_ESCWE|nr:Orotidine 5'-phosphate decarboxylase [Escovopsis weberi]
MPSHPTLKATFAERAETSRHPLTSYLFRLMDLKASNLCLSADVPTARELLSLADSIGPSIVVLKTHYDMVTGWDFHPETGTGAKLASLARKHGFLIFEDRKFGDIGHTVELQYTSGAARIIDWAHITNVNMVPGKASVTSLAKAAARWLERYPCEVRTSVTVGTPNMDQFGDDDDNNDNKDKDYKNNNNDADDHKMGDQTGTNGTAPAEGASQSRQSREGRKGSIVSVTTVTQQYESVASSRLGKTISEDEEAPFPGIEEAPLTRGLLILAQMSSQGNFMNKEYTQACVEAAREHPDFVMGFVAQECLNTEPEDAFIHMTPGCQLPPEDHAGDANGIVGGDGQGQQYNTPHKIINVCGTDIAIVGRGIIKADDPIGEADRYRSAAWKAYTERVR